MRVAPHELEKPVFYRDGRFLTLRDLGAKPALAVELALPEAISHLDLRTLQILVSARYEREPKNKRVHLVGRGSYSIDELVSEVRANSDVGQVVMKKEVNWISYLR